MYQSVPCSTASVKPSDHQFFGASRSRSSRTTSEPSPKPVQGNLQPSSQVINLKEANTPHVSLPTPQCLNGKADAEELPDSSSLETPYWSTNVRPADLTQSYGRQVIELSSYYYLLNQIGILGLARLVEVS